MMALGPYSRVVRQNLRRNFRHFAVSAFGIAVGIAAFVFFLGLSGGVRKVVLRDIFPIDRVEVIAPKTTLTGFKVVLDDALVARIESRAEVANAFPKLKMAFPAKAWGRLLGSDLHVEFGGFCDGMDPALAAGEPGVDLFRDWEEVEKDKLIDCGSEPENACPEPERRYCGWDHKCHHRVPVLLSRTLFEIYNGQFAPAHGMPRIGLAQRALIEQKMRNIRFTIALGESFIQGTSGNLKAAPEHIQGMLVGISDKAMPIGATVPIGYVRRWNQAYVGEQAAREYSSIVVKVKDGDGAAGLVSWVKQQGLETEESHAERYALVIRIVTLLFLLIAFVIVGLSAVNISHTFFMLIAERRREIGILRAVGATRADVRHIILGEAGLIGLCSGAIGVAAGVGAARLVDWVSARYVPNFPFKPTTYFLFTPELIAGALGFAIIFCVLGAFLPARKAASMQPAQALTA